MTCVTVACCGASPFTVAGQRRFLRTSQLSRKLRAPENGCDGIFPPIPTRGLLSRENTGEKYFSPPKHPPRHANRRSRKTGDGVTAMPVPPGAISVFKGETLWSNFSRGTAMRALSRAFPFLVILLNKARWGRGGGPGEGNAPLARAEGVPLPRTVSPDTLPRRSATHREERRRYPARRPRGRYLPGVWPPP